MRISDWSSDVCSSDLVIAAANECPVRIAALIYDPSDIAGDGRDAPQIDSVICFDAAITRRAGIGPGERLERHFHSLISRRSEEHTSELQSLMRISYAVFCLKKKKKINLILNTITYSTSLIPSYHHTHL